MDAPVYRFGDYRLDPVKRELAHGDTLVDTPPRVFACLVHLVEQRERAVDRAELIRALWRRDNVSDTQLFQLVLRARRAVGDDAESQQVIRTIVGFGYRWVAPTVVGGRAAEPAAAPAPSPEASAGPARRRNVSLTWGVVALVLVAAAFLLEYVAT